MLLGSCTRSVPQIMRIVSKRRSAMAPTVSHAAWPAGSCAEAFLDLHRSAHRTVLPRSAAGVSLGSQYAELIAYSITLAYNIRHSAAA